VGPQNRKPRAFSAFENRRESGVSAGTSACVAKRFRIGGREAVPDRRAVDELPAEIREPLAFLDVEIGARPGDGRLDLAAVADDARVGEQARDFRLAPARDGRGVEPGEGGAEILALSQDRDPGEPGLEPVEDELFPERAAVPLRHAPFGVVVGDIERVVPAPRAAVFHRLSPVRLGWEQNRNSLRFVQPGRSTMKRSDR